MSSRTLRFLVAITLAGANSAFFSVPVRAAERCEGTICDLYYEHVASPQPAAPASTPVQAASAPAVPAASSNDSVIGSPFSGSSAQPAPSGTTPAPIKKPLVGVQGGGVIGLLNGTAPKRCTGTLCDLFYGGPPPEEPAVAPTEAAVAPEPASEQSPVPQERGQLEEAPRESDTRPTCVVDAHDPWRCFRH